jgi:quinol monooxygenase YgiN
VIARINQFQAAPGHAAELRVRLTEILAPIARADGCQAVTLLRSHEDHEAFVIYEVWQSVDHHQAAAAVIPPELVASTVAMLAAPPSGYYLTVEAVG